MSDRQVVKATWRRAPHVARSWKLHKHMWCLLAS